MDSRKILTLVGGISRNSLNKKLFEAVKVNCPEGFELITFPIQDLPYFSQDLENAPPELVVTYKKLINQTDAVLFITPEYNRSFPGVLKNAIDWGSRPYGQNIWNKKVSAVMGASPGNIGTFGAQHHLRQVMAYLNMRVLGQPEFYLNASHTFDEKGKLIDKQTEEYLKGYLHAFTLLINESFQGRPTVAEYKSKGLEDSPRAH